MGNLSSNMTCEEADTTFKLDASLQKRIEARTEERNKKRAEQDELKDPTENQFEFNAKFRQAVSALEAQIAAAQQAKKDGEEDASLETRFTNMTAEHTSISALAVEGSQHLPLGTSARCKSASKSSSRPSSMPGRCVFHPRNSHSRASGRPRLVPNPSLSQRAQNLPHNRRPMHPRLLLLKTPNARLRSSTATASVSSFRMKKAKILTSKAARTPLSLFRAKLEHSM